MSFSVRVPRRSGKPQTCPCSKHKPNENQRVNRVKQLNLIERSLAEKKDVRKSLAFGFQSAAFNDNAGNGANVRIYIRSNKERKENV